MKGLSKTIPIILLTIFTISKGLTYAEATDQTENKTVTSSFGWTRAEGEKGFHLDFDGAVLYGPISGYVQTPLGGTPSSASNKRPKFKELGINNMTLFNLSLSASMDQHSLYGAVHLVDLDGERTLDESLVFHGMGYAAGTRVKSDVRLNWYEMGYRYAIDFGRERTNLRIAPTIAFALFDFKAGLESNGEKNDRSYLKGTPRVGLELEWLPWNRFSINGKGIGSLPFNNTPSIYTFGLTGKYNILERIA